MRVFLDTNVLVSAFTARGLCADLFKAATVSCELVVSGPLLEELRRTLATKFQYSAEEIAEAVEIIEQDALDAPAGPALDIKIQDTSDIHILSTAIHGKADVFVTGDREVLALGKVCGMRIASPRQFWEVLRNR